MINKIKPKAKKIAAGLTITGYDCVVEEAILKRSAEKPIPAGMATIEERINCDMLCNVHTLLRSGMVKPISRSTES